MSKSCSFNIAGCSCSESVNIDMVFRTPFLQEPHDKWPSECDTSSHSVDKLELRPRVNLKVQVNQVSIITDIINNYSSYYKIFRDISYIFGFFKRISPDRTILHRARLPSIYPIRKQIRLSFASSLIFNQNAMPPKFAASKATSRCLLNCNDYCRFLSICKSTKGLISSGELGVDYPIQICLLTPNISLANKGSSIRSFIFRTAASQASPRCA